MDARPVESLQGPPRRAVLGGLRIRAQEAGPESIGAAEAAEGLEELFYQTTLGAAVLSGALLQRLLSPDVVKWSEEGAEVLGAAPGRTYAWSRVGMAIYRSVRAWRDDCVEDLPECGERLTSLARAGVPLGRLAESWVRSPRTLCPGWQTEFGCPGLLAYASSEGLEACERRLAPEVQYRVIRQLRCAVARELKWRKGVRQAWVSAAVRARPRPRPEE